MACRIPISEARCGLLAVLLRVEGDGAGAWVVHARFCAAYAPDAASAAASSVDAPVRVRSRRRPLEGAAYGSRIAFRGLALVPDPGPLGSRLEADGVAAA